MLFAHDTSAALLLAADLVNAGDLADVDALEAILDKNRVAPRPAATQADLVAVAALRPRLRAVWEAGGTERVARLVNDLLRDSGARPWLVDHGGGFGWHLHVTGHEAALEHRLAAQAAFAFADLVRLREEGRLRRCEAPGCEAVFADLSKNRSRRYCDTGNCGNKQHVAAYRERRRALTAKGSAGLVVAPPEGCEGAPGRDHASLGDRIREEIRPVVVTITGSRGVLRNSGRPEAGQ